MRWEGKRLSKPEKEAVVSYLGKDDVPPIPAIAACARDLDPPPNPPVWTNWGADVHNTRFQSLHSAKISRDNIPKLTLRWAFAFPGAYATYGQPTASAGRIFVGSEDGTVYSLDAATGCMWWSFRASTTVKTAVSTGMDGTLVFFGDTNGFVYALRSSDGTQAWRVHPENHPAARITGSPILSGTKLYVPISSGEEGAAADPRYPCCTFRGSVVALDARSGKLLWKTYTIDEPPRPIGEERDGVQQWGPSGAAVWSAPTLDLKRRLLYVATGNNYSDPTTRTSDAVLALEMETGRKIWSQQFTNSDMWNGSCFAEQKTSCPDGHGEDYDFGSPPILRRVTGRGDLLVIGQKSGIVYALNPDDGGKLVWKTRIAKGGALGGIQWGGAADNRYAYFPVSDFDDQNPLTGGGVYALDLRDGAQRWYAPPPHPACMGAYGCSAAQMAPPTIIPGALFAGSLDGHLRAYDAGTGGVIWDFNTAHEFQTVNGVKGHGGSLNGSGVAIVDGMLYVNSGYTNAMDGNVLLAFWVPPE
jgi:polyvinyl alcohol dehydrogenase (cytochrome)